MIIKDLLIFENGAKVAHTQQLDGFHAALQGLIFVERNCKSFKIMHIINYYAATVELQSTPIVSIF